MLFQSGAVSQIETSGVTQRFSGTHLLAPVFLGFRQIRRFQVVDRAAEPVVVKGRFAGDEAVQRPDHAEEKAEGDGLDDFSQQPVGDPDRLALAIVDPQEHHEFAGGPADKTDQRPEDQDRDAVGDGQRGIGEQEIRWDELRQAVMNGSCGGHRPW